MLSTVFADIVAAVMPVAYADASNEAVAFEADGDSKPASKAEEKDEAVLEQKDEKDDESESAGEAEAEAEEEEEEEEEEPEDPKPILEAECAETECKGPRHHYDECVERVTSQIDEKGRPDEDCVEEFFHLVHCTTACAAPKLWAQLK